MRWRKGREIEGALAWVALLITIGISAFASGQALPDGRGKAEFERICTTCHVAAMSTRLGKSADDWKSVVADMTSRGAQGSQADLDNVVLYLSTNFGPGKGASASTAQTARAPATVAVAAPTPGAALGTSDAEHAKRVISQNGCAACHRVGEEGSYVGPTLNGIGSRKTAEEIRAAIVSPQPTVQPSNRQVRLVGADGKTVSGKILNQDGYSVQMVQASGQLATYSKVGAREFTIIDANPMPSFAGKISGQDLDVLVRYLNSLGEPGK